MKNRFRIFLLGLLSLTAGTLFADTFDAMVDWNRRVEVGFGMSGQVKTVEVRPGDLAEHQDDGVEHTDSGRCVGEQLQPDIVGEAFGHDARPDDADEKEGGTEEFGEQTAGEIVHRRSCTTAGRVPHAVDTECSGLGPGRRSPSTGPQFPWRGIGGRKPPSWCQNGPASVSHRTHQEP